MWYGLRPHNSPALVAIFDASRHNMGATWREEVMNDPGTNDYLEATETVVREGVGALFDRTEAPLPLLTSFDLTESLGCFRADAGKSAEHRWLAVFSTCLLLFGATDTLSLSELMAELVANGLAVMSSPLLQKLFIGCQEITNVRTDNVQHDGHPDGQRLLAQLVLSREGVGYTDQETDAACNQLITLGEMFQHAYFSVSADMTEWEPNPWHVPGKPLLRAIAGSRRSERCWQDLIRCHLPRRSKPLQDLAGLLLST
jgi:hypothetical protein